MTKQRLLPNFGKRNPFQEDKGERVAKEVERSSSAQSSLDLAEKSSETPTISTPAGVPSSDAVVSEDTTSTSPKPKPSRPPAVGGWRRLFRWPFGRQGRRLHGKDAVQAELSLDSIQPIRNTLVDTDLELVMKPAKPPSNPFIGTVSRQSNAEEAAARKRAPQSGGLWTRLKKRLSK